MCSARNSTSALLVATCRVSPALAQPRIESNMRPASSAWYKYSHVLPHHGSDDGCWEPKEWNCAPTLTRSAVTN